MPQLNQFRAALKPEELEKVLAKCDTERRIYLVQRRGLNQNACRVCLMHSEVATIDREILTQVPLRDLAQKYKLSFRMLQGHWARHIRDHIRKALGTDFAAQDTNYLLAKAMRKRSHANFDHRNRIRAMEFMIADLVVLRKAFFGDIDANGKVFKEPNLEKLLQIDGRIITLTAQLEKIDDLKRKRSETKRKAKGTDGKKKPKSDTLDDELVPKEQQEEMDRADRLNKEMERDAAKTN